MENYFSEVMSKRSDKELWEIIEKKNSYQEEAYIAAIEELEKRNLATKELILVKRELIEKQTEDQRKVMIEKKEKKVERKKAFKEAIELLQPGKNYFYTPIIIYLNVTIFIIMVLSGVDAMEPSVESLLKWGGNLRALTVDGQYWRLLTNIFLHGGLIHLVFNMYALIYIGGLLERKFGNHRFLLVYSITGIFASIASIMYNENIVSIGASGAIFGIYGLFLSLLISKKYNVPEDSRQNLISSIVFFIGYNLFYGFTKKGIDNAAHIGGLISGFIIGFAYYPAFRQPKYSRFISTGLVIITLVTVLMIPKFITNAIGDFQNVITAFSKNEDKALWIYQENLSTVSPDRKQFYYDKLKTEGTDLWDANLKLLSSLHDLPPYLTERVDILREYCDLRKESYILMQSLLNFNRDSDRMKLNDVNSLIESKINKLKELNK